MDKTALDELVELAAETVCTNKEMVRIAKDEFPAAFVRERLMKLDSEHIGYVLDCIAKTNKKIGNIKAYVLACLFNAPAKCTAIFNIFVGAYYVDDKYGIVRDTKPPGRDAER